MNYNKIPMLKAAIYDPYLDTLGGGERYCLSVVEVLLKHNYQVDIFWSGSKDILSKAQSRFGLELTGANLVPDIFNEHPHQIECVENQDVLGNLVSRHLNTNDYVARIKNFFTKFSVTRQYDVFFYISDWSIPFLFSKNNLLHIQLPLAKTITPKQKFFNWLKLINFTNIICNSKFTRQVAQSRLGNKCMVVYPPVDTVQFSPNAPKQNIILSVGRFDILFNSKKQEVMIDAFKKMYDQHHIDGWKLVLTGGVLQHIDHNTYLVRLKELAKGYPIEFQINPDFTTLKQIYESAKIYWHAAGFEVNEDIHPENTEHFGIAPVEAMASGAVPILVNKGGLGEIILDGQTGYLWNTIDELVSKTQLLIATPDKLTKISKECVTASRTFSKQVFETNLSKIIKL